MEIDTRKRPKTRLAIWMFIFLALLLLVEECANNPQYNVNPPDKFANKFPGK